MNLALINSYFDKKTVISIVFFEIERNIPNRKWLKWLILTRIGNMNLASPYFTRRPFLLLYIFRNWTLYTKLKVAKMVILEIFRESVLSDNYFINMSYFLEGRVKLPCPRQYSVKICIINRLCNLRREVGMSNIHIWGFINYLFPPLASTERWKTFSYIFFFLSRVLDHKKYEKFHVCEYMCIV